MTHTQFPQIPNEVLINTEQGVSVFHNLLCRIALQPRQFAWARRG